MSDFKRYSSLPDLLEPSSTIEGWANGLKRSQSCSELKKPSIDGMFQLNKDPKQKEAEDNARAEERARRRAMRNMGNSRLAMERTDLQITEYFHRLQMQYGINVNPEPPTSCMDFRQQKIFCAVAIIVNAILAIIITAAWYWNL